VKYYFRPFHFRKKSRVLKAAITQAFEKKKNIISEGGSRVGEQKGRYHIKGEGSLENRTTFVRTTGGGGRHFSPNTLKSFSPFLGVRTPKRILRLKVTVPKKRVGTRGEFPGD